MGKKTHSINLETKRWREVDKYMEANDLSSRSLAVEWMLVEYQTMKDMIEYSKSGIVQPDMIEPVTTIEEVGTKPTQDNVELKRSLVSQLTGNMPLE